MIVFPRLEPFHIVQLGIAETNGISVVKESVTGTVVSILATFFEMRVYIAIQNSYCYTVVRARVATIGKGQLLVIAHSTGRL